MNFIGLLRTLEQISRPPRLGHDVDEPLAYVSQFAAEVCRAHGAETCFVCNEDDDDLWVHPRDVAEEREAEDELAADDDEPVDFECMACGAMYSKSSEHDCPTLDDTPNPTEPGLTPDELVGVRGLLQERCVPGLLQERFGEACTCPSWGNPNWPHRHGCPADPRKSSPSNHTGTGAEPNPSPTIVQSAPPPTVDGEGPASVREHSPAPAEGRSDLIVLFDQFIQKWVDVGYHGHLLDNDDNDGERVRRAIRAAALLDDDAPAEWVGWAVPAISAVLAEHNAKEDALERVVCRSQRGGSVAVFSDWQEWREHVAPLIANALAPQDK
jgi:hypothetical protein